MERKHRTTLLAAALACLLILVAGGLGRETFAQPGAGVPAEAAYMLLADSVDGGGTAWGISGPYTLGGTAGQADASGVLASGPYVLAGGLWGATAPAAGGPDIRVDPESLSAALCPNGSEVQTLNVCNDGDADLTWSAGEDLPWLTVTPDTGTVGPGECDPLAVEFFGPGSDPFDGIIAFSSNDPDTPQLDVPVSLTILEPATIVDVSYTLNGYDVAFDATLAGEPPLDILWAFGDGQTSTEEDPVHTYPEVDCYDVTLAVANLCGQDAWAGQVCLGVPVIEVQPTELDVSLCPDEQAVRTFTICNQGSAALDWSLNEAPAGLGRETFAQQGQEEAEPNSEGTPPPSQPEREGGEPAPSPARGEALSLQLEGLPVPGGPVVTAPPLPEAPVALILDDGSVETLAGIGGTRELLFLNRFTPEPGQFPFELEEIQVYFGSAGGVLPGDDLLLLVYENPAGGFDPAPGSVLRAALPAAVQAVDAWNVYPLADPLHLAGPGDVLLGVLALETPGVSYYPAAIDTDASQGRSWLGTWLASPPPEPPLLPPDGTWTLVDDAGLPGNWLVRGAGRQALPWLREEPAAGTLAPGLCEMVLVTFDATGLAPGGYAGQIVVQSNDPLQPQVAVTATLTVTEAVHDAGFGWDPPEPVAGEEITFQATAQGSEPIDYAWDWGDGGGGGGAVATHTYAAPGDYPVTLTATNACGQAVVQQTVPVAPAGVAHVAWIVTSYLDLGDGLYAVRGRVRIVDAARVPVTGAEAHVEWTAPNGMARTQSRLTNASGTVAFQVRARLLGDWQLCVADVIKAGWLYDPESNRETCETITVP